MPAKVHKLIVIMTFSIIFTKLCILDFYHIPTSSMEDTIQTGSTVLVSKVHYGLRVPITPLQIPFIHSARDSNNKILYSNWIQLPAFRLPGFAEVNYGDIIVFNYPKEVTYPIDIRTPYIKRCVGTPGDTIKYIDGTLNRNSKLSDKFLFVKQKHLIESKKKISNTDFNKNDIESFSRLYPNHQHSKLLKEKYIYEMLTNRKKLKQFLKRNEQAKLLVKRSEVDNEITSKYLKLVSENWTTNNFGPIVVPCEGLKIEINKNSISLYIDIITHHESNKKVIIKGSKLIIDDRVTNYYVFKQDYYFVMGDNRTFSKDSRFWGFVPQDHIVGKAIFDF